MGIQVNSYCYQCKNTFAPFEEVALVSSAKFIPAHRQGVAPWNKNTLEPKRHRHTNHVKNLPNKNSIFCKKCWQRLNLSLMVE